jgi:hypothetical protein
MYDYGDTENETPTNKFIEESSITFTIIFTVEAVIKILAMGFITHP